MNIPKLAEPVQRDVSRARVMDAGITASFCSPCVLGHRVCCSIWPPGCHVENCSGGGAVCSPCIPFLNKKYCVPGGWTSC
jgi:hypothetical protein